MNLEAAGLLEKLSQEAREWGRKGKHLKQKYIIGVVAAGQGAITPTMTSEEDKHTACFSISCTWRWGTEAFIHRLSSSFFGGCLWEMLLPCPSGLCFCTGQVDYCVFRGNPKAERKKCSWSRRLSAWMQPQGDCTTAASGIRGRPRGKKKAKRLQPSPPLAPFISVLCLLSTMILFWSGGAFFFQCGRFIEIVYHLCCSKLISIISRLQTYLVFQLV